MPERHEFKQVEKFEDLQYKVEQWAKDKGILSSLNASKQMLKVNEEVGELTGALLKNDKAGIVDGIGDSLVTLIILSAQLDLDPVDCLQAAWDEIKNRTGKTKNGVFVKD